MIQHPPPDYRNGPWQRYGSSPSSSQYHGVYHHGVFEQQNVISQATSTRSFASTQSSENLSEMTKDLSRWVSPSQATFGGLPSWLSPPPHSRSLYATIPLPPVSVADQWEVQDGQASLASLGKWGVSSSTGPTAPNPHPWHIPPRSPSSPNSPPPIKLHPLLETTYLTARQNATQTSRASLSSPSSPVSVTRHYHEPATTPEVSYLAIQVYSTAEHTTIYPSSPQSPHAVSVGDVLTALDPFFIVHGPHHEGCQNANQTWSYECECDRVMLAINSLRLWWDVDELALQGQRPWQLVIGRQ